AEAERLYGAFLRLSPAASLERAQAHLELGRVLYSRGRTGAALAGYEAALADARSLGDRALEADALHALASTHHDSGDVARGREPAQRGGHAAEPGGPRALPGAAAARGAEVRSGAGRGAGHRRPEAGGQHPGEPGRLSAHAGAPGAGGAAPGAGAAHRAGVGR